MLSYMEKAGNVSWSTPPQWHGLGLPVMICGAGRQFIDTTEYSWPGLKRGNVEKALFQYTLEGRGALRYDDRVYDMTPGKAIVIHYPYDNRYWFPEDSSGWRFFYLSFSGKLCVSLWKEIIFRLGPSVDIPLDSSLRRVADELVEKVVTAAIATPYQASSLAYDFATRLLEMARATQADSRACPKPLTDALAYIEENLTRPMDIDALASKAGLSRYYFSRLFHGRFGASPMAYVRDARLEKAAALLTNTNLSVKEIAFRCGFEDCNYFCRLFRRREGASPGAYRENASRGD